MRKHIEDLATRGIKRSEVEVPTANRIFDIRVQPGGSVAAEILKDYASIYGITIRIDEFGG